MTLGIITFHFVNNFGGVLQSLALQEALKSFNVDCKIIDYRNKFVSLTDFIRLFPITKNIQEFFSGIRTFKKRIKRVKKFHTFAKTFLSLTQRYSKAKLNRNPPKFDKYICGSDQIWNVRITAGISQEEFFL